MESFLIKALQFIIALAFLVIIHEFGHYIFAKIGRASCRERVCLYV